MPSATAARAECLSPSSRPAKDISPCQTGCSPNTAWSNVVLPAPLWPRSAIASPRPIGKIDVVEHALLAVTGGDAGD